MRLTMIFFHWLRGPDSLVDDEDAAMAETDAPLAAALIVVGGRGRRRRKMEWRALQPLPTPAEHMQSRCKVGAEFVANKDLHAPRRCRLSVAQKIEGVRGAAPRTLPDHARCRFDFVFAWNGPAAGDARDLSTKQTFAEF